MELLTLLAYVGCTLVALVTAGLSIISAQITYKYWRYSHIPSPKRSSFFLGHFSEYLHLKKETGNDEVPLSTMFQKWHKAVSSPVFVVHLPGMTSVVLADPDLVREVTMQPKNGKSRQLMSKMSTVFGERLGGSGISTIPDYDTWKPRRRLYDPAFRKSYLQSILPAFNSSVDLFIHQLKPLANGETQVPMKQHFSEVTMDVISKVAFGTDFTEALRSKMSSLRRAKSNGRLTYLVDNILSAMTKSILVPWFKYLHPLEAEAYRETIRALRSIGRECIQKRIKMVESGAEVPNDILTHMLQMASVEDEVDIEVLVDDFVTFYVAGQETTSNALSFALVMICTHPSVYERLQAEVKEVVGTKTTITKDDLDKLQFTEQVILETLRLYGPAFGITKEAPPEGLTLSGYYIPGGTLLSLQSSLLCRLPEYFDDPDTFNPDRFDPENNPPSSFVYFPFGIGHRSCIGKHFALMEMKMILVRVVQTFEITLPPDYKLVLADRFTIQPKDSVPCKLTLRNLLASKLNMSCIN